MSTSSSEMKKMPKRLSMISIIDGLLDDQSMQSCLLSLISEKPVVVSTRWASVLDLVSVTSCT